MARPLRIEYPGAFYHITARGNEQKDIVRDDKDRERFLEYLETAAGRYGAVIHVYCLMSNHYHLLLSTPEGNLSQIMRHINGAYTTWFNKRHNRFGHLFQGRYKAILVDADPYAGELSRYIHLNPVRAGIVRRPEQYQWSSYASYSGKAKPPRWLTTDWLLLYFGQKPDAARKAYAFFVNAAMGKEEEDPLKEATSSLILGKAGFVDDIRKKYLGGKKGVKNIPALREIRKTSLEAITEAVGQEFRDEPELARKAALYLSHRHSGRPLQEIGSKFGIGESGVSQASGRFNVELERNRKLKRRIDRIRKTLDLS
jgi:REP element-mobilizing transposase RayT